MPFRRYILNNWGQKLASLGFAVMIWVAVHSNLQKEIKVPRDSERTDATRSFPRRPITVMTATTDHRTVRVFPDEVNVNVRGEIALLNRLNTDDIQPFVKLSSRQNSSGPCAVQVYLPPGVSLDEVMPKAVKIELVKNP